MKQYTETRDWIEEKARDNATIVYQVGISQAAVDEVGPIVWIELPQLDQKLIQGEVAVVIESTKAAVDIAAPLSGVVRKVNECLLSRNEAALRLINEDPEGEGWLYEVICHLDR